MSPDELLVTVDGQVGTSFVPGETLTWTARQSRVDRPLSRRDFFSDMRDKLGWGGLPAERDQPLADADRAAHPELRDHRSRSRCRSRGASTCSRARPAPGSRSSSARSDCCSASARARISFAPAPSGRRSKACSTSPIGRRSRRSLDERGIEVEDDTLVCSSARSPPPDAARAWINGTPVTATVLAEIGRQLVNLHGQHEAQTLLDARSAARDPRCVRGRGRVAGGARAQTHRDAGGSSPRDRRRSPRAAPRPRSAPTICGTSRRRSRTRASRRARTSTSRTKRAGSRTPRSCAALRAGLNELLSTATKRVVLQQLATRRSARSLPSSASIRRSRGCRSCTTPAYYALEALARELEEYAASSSSIPRGSRRCGGAATCCSGLPKKYGPTLS